MRSWPAPARQPSAISSATAACGAARSTSGIEVMCPCSSATSDTCAGSATAVRRAGITLERIRPTNHSRSAAAVMGRTSPTLRSSARTSDRHDLFLLRLRHLMEERKDQGALGQPLGHRQGWLGVRVGGLQVGCHDAAPRRYAGLGEQPQEIVAADCGAPPGAASRRTGSWSRRTAGHRPSAAGDAGEQLLIALGEDAAPGHHLAGACGAVPGRWLPGCRSSGS